jgi:Ca-activated chloride channel homolog
MAINNFLLKIPIFLMLLLLIGIRASGNLPDKGQTKKESAEDAIHQQQDTPTDEECFKIKLDVNLITADVTVIGAPSSELCAEDFIVYDNNIAQPVSYYSRDQLPLAVAILIDKSGSTEPYLPVLQIAGVSALRRLKPEDQVALFAFDYGWDKLSDLTEDRLLISDKISGIKFGGQTNIYNPIYDAAKYLKKHAPRRRHSIILISDNIQNMPGPHNAEQCRAELLETATTLYNIAIRPIFPEGFGPSGLQQEKYSQILHEIEEIKQLAKETGGDAMDVAEPSSIKTIMEKAINRLRMQYTLGFNPSNPGKPGSFHKLDVRFANKDSCPGCQILVRTGYYEGVVAPLPPKEKIGTPPPHPPHKMDELLVHRSIEIAGKAEINLDEILFTPVASEQMDPRGHPQIQIQFQINPAGIDLSAVEGRNTCHLIAAIFYSDELGRTLGSNWLPIEKQLSREEYAAILKTGIPFSAMVPLKTKNQKLKIVVYDVRSDNMGSRSILFHHTAKQKPGN